MFQPIHKYSKHKNPLSQSSNLIPIKHVNHRNNLNTTKKISFVNLNNNMLIRSLSGSNITKYQPNDIFNTNLNMNNNIPYQKPFSGNLLSNKRQTKYKQIQRDINTAKSILKVSDYPSLKIYCTNMMQYYNPLQNYQIHNINNFLLHTRNIDNNPLLLNKVKVRFNSPTSKRTKLLQAEYNNIYNDNNKLSLQIMNNSAEKDFIKSISPYNFHNMKLHIKPFSSQSSSRIIQINNMKNDVDCGVTENIGHRKQMEDCSVLITNGFMKNKKYFALFDGHGGKFSAEYCKQYLHELIKQNIIKYKDNSFEDNIKLSFENISLFITKTQDIPNDVGNTASVVIINNNKEIYCANVGDSKCVLIKKNKTIITLTTEHTCSNVNEVNRVRNSKGIVFQGRVFGKLVLTRSIGDKEMKNYGIIATPSINKVVINNNEDLCIIMGSDGIWDVLNDEKIIDIIFNNNNINVSSAQQLSQDIIDRALKEGTGDNVTCIVIKL